MTFYSSLLSAGCILVFSRIALASNLITCKLPHNFTIQVTKTQRATLYESDLTIFMDYDAISLTSYKETNSLNVKANNVVVNFNGIMYMESADVNVPSVPRVLVQTFNDRISGVARREMLNSSYSGFYGCRIMLLSSEMDRPGMSGRIANEIRRLAESCIELELCPNIGRSKPRFMAKLPVDNVSDLMFVRPDPLVIVTDGCEEVFDVDIVQPIVNKAVDVALKQVSEKLRTLNGGTVSIPTVKKEFSTGTSIFKTNGVFKAIHGQFRDLTSVRRVSNVSLSHNAMKVTAACEFGLGVAELIYPIYELKYGIIYVTGELSGRLDNTALRIQVAVDYNHSPCRVAMEHLKVTRLGKLDIQLTGLGGLNWMFGKLLNWITITWREEILVNLQRQLLDTIQHQLSTLDCEKYRPEFLDRHLR